MHVPCPAEARLIVRVAIVGVAHATTAARPKNFRRSIVRSLSIVNSAPTISICLAHLDTRTPYAQKSRRERSALNMPDLGISQIQPKKRGTQPLDLLNR